MEYIYSLDEAESWFLKNSTGSVLCSKKNLGDEIIKRINCYPDAEEFYGLPQEKRLYYGLFEDKGDYILYNHGTYKTFREVLKRKKEMSQFRNKEDLFIIQRLEGGE